MKKVFFVGLGIVVTLCIAGSAYGQVMFPPPPTGTLPDGATYLIEVPPNWNGTLLLYSHGYVVPGTLNPAFDAGDPLTRLFLLGNGFALAGSSYATTGWAVHEALPDQIAVLDIFESAVGKPKRTIAWGHSLGGMITAGLIQRFPERFNAALPMCGVLSGGVGTWNQALDAAFAFKTLLAPGVQVVDISNPIANLDSAEATLLAAQATPQGQARVALVAALGDGPGWFDPASAEPAEDDFATQESNQFQWASQVDFPFAFAFRAELEFRAQGNVSSNRGVDYRKQLERSIDREEVRALYEQAGLDLDKDLDTLNDAARIGADREALKYLERNITYNGEIDIPVLTMHTKGDGLVVVQNESAYKDVVDEEGNGRFLRRTFVHRAGHCTFTPAEMIAALAALIHRLDKGTWPDLRANELNEDAGTLGPLNIAPPAFIDFRPSVFLRPFEAPDPDER